MRLSNYYMGKSKTMTVEFINGNYIKSRDALYDRLTEKLQLPDYFGRNLDALFDVLTDPDVIRGRTYLTVIDTPTLIENLGDYGERFIRTLEDASFEKEDFIFLKH